MLTLLLPEIIMKICGELDFTLKSYGWSSFVNVPTAVYLYYTCKTFKYIKDFKLIGLSYRNINDPLYSWVTKMVDIKSVALNGLFHGLHATILYNESTHQHKDIKNKQTQLHAFKYYNMGKQVLYLRDCGIVEINNIGYCGINTAPKLEEIWKNMQIEIPNLLDSFIKKSLFVIDKPNGLQQPIIEIANGDII